MKMGVLTGGGDCPGLNAALRAVVKHAERSGDSILGIKNGWAGLIQGQCEPLTEYSVSGILPKGGTILGTSRTNLFKNAETLQRGLANYSRFGLDALIAIGGEDTLGVALKLHEGGIKVVGVPKTIDNDLSGTDFTFGFDTAVYIATEAIDRLHSTAEAHHRVMVVEVMGRHTGWIAVYSGIAGGADGILIPEHPFDIAELCEQVKRRQSRGKDFSIIVVAEGAKPKEGGGITLTKGGARDEFGHERLGGISNIVGAEIERRTGIETRVTILGHVQRGGTPTPFDRILATRCGVSAVNQVHEGKFGTMVAMRGQTIVAVPLSEAVGQIKQVNMELFDVARVFFG
ncbi:MAG: 6-phosphofructokinase [Planctomycetes bacterium]|nr:6-phosphofructokinase [Planctomycetota bacterium]